MTAQTVTCLASLLGVAVVGIPLTVEIIGHVDNIIHNLANLRDGKLLQTPVGGRRSDGDGFARQ
jgi:hypothetical protein